MDIPQSEYTTATEALIRNILALPNGVPLDDLLRPVLEQDYTLRQLFATAPEHPTLADRYAGLIDPFGTNYAIWKTRGRPEANRRSADEKYIFPRRGPLRRPLGWASIVSSLEEFKENWSVFTHGVLSSIKNWDNMVVAGGSVLACLTPVPGSSNKDRNKFYQLNYPESDIDIFLWGLNASEAEEKMAEIYKSVNDSLEWDVVCVRKANVISIHTLYPFRPIQIVLRLYESPAKILIGFDVDCTCCAYDGTTVWMNWRSMTACIRQCNTVDITRRSPSYEVRLAKYATRGYEIYLPSLSRDKIDDAIFKNVAPKSLNGLARLLLLEYLILKPVESMEIVESPADYFSLKAILLRGSAPVGPGRRLRAKVDSNDYDVMWVIPYSPTWNVKRIKDAIQKIDRHLNSPVPNFDIPERRLHRHALYAGSMRECLDNFCPNCPVPLNKSEEHIVEEESGKYIRGRVRFIDANAGRQILTGSFRPIDIGEWEDGSYIISPRFQSTSASPNINLADTANTSA